MGVSDSTQQELDKQLMVQVAQGDQLAFSALYDRLSGPLYSLGLKMLGDAAEAEDALQEICLQIWRRAATYDATRSSVFTWAVLLTRSKIIDRLRARGRRSRIVVASTEDEDNPIVVAEASVAETTTDTIGRNEEAARVQTVLSKLPAEQRQAIEMAFFSELTHHQIATQIEQPLGTVKARIRRGLLRLRDELRRSNDR
jgi:RNA polymerase sigma-70 factor (ECF subfamily)